MLDIENRVAFHVWNFALDVFAPILVMLGARTGDGWCSTTSLFFFAFADMSIHFFVAWPVRHPDRGCKGWLRSYIWIDNTSIWKRVVRCDAMGA